jgi:hypothetical protein
LPSGKTGIVRPVKHRWLEYNDEPYEEAEGVPVRVLLGLAVATFVAYLFGRWLAG